MNDPYGIVGQPAPELRVEQFLANTDGALRIADIEESVIYLYGFQFWCPGCHSHGFPTLAAVKQAIEAAGHGDAVKFVAIQTVF